jgi:hypothetical protein
VSVPLVVIELDVHEAPRSLATTLAEACSGSIPEGECRYDDPASGAPFAVATVKWGGDGERSVHIEVGTKRRGQPEWLSKTLQFRSVDPRAERWRSVGLTIATLVRELSGDEAPTLKGAGASAVAAGETSSGPPAAAQPGPTVPGGPAPAEGGAPGPAPGAAPATSAAAGSSGGSAPAPADDSDGDRGSTSAARRDVRTPFWVDIGAVAGPAFTAGDARIGGYAALGVQLASSPFFARFSLGHEVHPAGADALSARYTTLSAGAGAMVRWKPVPLTLEPRVAFLVERTGVSASDAQGGSDDSSQWSAGVHAGASLVWELGWVAPVVGVEAFWRGPPTDVLLEDRVVATVPAVSWTFQAGVRFFL